MRPAGEVHHEKGRDRSMLFGACLQQIVKGFRAEFYSIVPAHASKLDVELPADRKFSFDILGRLNNEHADCEIWIESKGYDTSSKLMQYYRDFVINVALARLYHSRIRNDLFWFISSTSFACDLGAKLATSNWIREVITNNAESEKPRVTADELSQLQDTGFDELSRHISALILTPQLMKMTGLKQFVQAGDDLWRITEKLYGGTVPVPDYRPYSISVERINRLPSADHLDIGQELELPFLGWPADDIDEIEGAQLASPNEPTSCGSQDFLAVNAPTSNPTDI